MTDIRKQVKDSIKQEQRVADALGGRRVGGSGSQWSHKGDAKTTGANWFDPDHVLVEAKRTDKKSYSIKSSELEKLFDEATLQGRIGILTIELNGRDYVLTELADYLELRGDV